MSEPPEGIVAVLPYAFVVKLLFNKPKIEDVTKIKNYKLRKEGKRNE
nr:MAG TPA: hypothetical protein [Caudoviricetes sp.]